MRKLSFILLLCLNVSILFAKNTTFISPPWGHTWGIQRVDDKDLQLRFKDMSFSYPEQLSVTRIAETDDPKTEDDNFFVTVYGVNSGTGTIIFNTSMFTLSRYGEKGSGKGQLRNPHGIFGNEKGDVFVCDSGNSRVVHLYNNTIDIQRELLKKETEATKGFDLKAGGEFFSMFGGLIEGIRSEAGLVERGYIGSGWQYPYDVCQDSEGRIYISDYKAHSVRVFSEDGKRELLNIPVLNPTGLVVRDEGEGKYKHSAIGRPIAYTNRDVLTNFLAVVCESGKRVNVYDLQGEMIYSKSVDELGIPDAAMRYVDSDHYLHLIITDSKNHRLYKLSQDLELISVFGSRGEGDGKFIHPTGIAVHRRYGMIFVAESTGAQYYWVGTDIKSISAYFDDNKDLRIGVKLTEPSELRIRLFERRGGREKAELARRVTAYDLDAEVLIKRKHLERRRLDIEKGRRYYLEIEATPTYSSRGKLTVRKGTYLVWR